MYLLHLKQYKCKKRLIEDKLQDPRGTWTTEALEETIEAIGAGRCFVQRVYRSWSIPLNFIYDHLNRQTRSRKMGVKDVLTNEEDVIVMAWVLAMQKVGMSITMHQLKMKVAKLTQTMATPFQNGTPSTTCTTRKIVFCNLIYDQVVSNGKHL